MFRLPTRRGALLAFMACSAGCGGSDETPAPSIPAPTVSCTADARLDSYTGELDKAGEQGTLSFRFFDLEPAPPAKGSNTFHVQVTDSGGPMQGDLRVDLRMPDHGHGTSVEPVITLDPAVSTYTVKPLYLFMPGVWRLDFEVYGSDAEDAPLLDSVALHFCVEG